MLRRIERHKERVLWRGGVPKRRCVDIMNVSIQKINSFQLLNIKRVDDNRRETKGRVKLMINFIVFFPIILLVRIWDTVFRRMDFTLRKALTYDYRRFTEKVPISFTLNKIH